MTRIARVVALGCSHHVAQRGNRRQRVFEDDDCRAYLALMAGRCGEWGHEVWAHCLMPNHVPLVVVPVSEEGLRCGIGEAHRRQTRRGSSRRRGMVEIPTELTELEFSCVARGWAAWAAGRRLVFFRVGA